MSDDVYVTLAKTQLADEAATAAATAVADRARALQHADEEKSRICGLCERHGLDPATTSPRELSDRMQARKDEFWSDVFSGGPTIGLRRQRELATTHGLDPEADREAVWSAVMAKEAAEHQARAA